MDHIALEDGSIPLRFVTRLVLLWMPDIPNTACSALKDPSRKRGRAEIGERKQQQTLTHTRMHEIL